jgi:hypothetical protein
MKHTLRGLALLLLALLIAVACGGSRVGDEEYFAGAPLPEPEKEDAAPVRSSSAAAVVAAPKPPSCDNPPERGFARCNKERSNVPCVYGDIGGCLVRCEVCNGQEGCTERAPMPWACPAAENLPGR